MWYIVITVSKAETYIADGDGVCLCQFNAGGISWDVNGKLVFVPDFPIFHLSERKNKQQKNDLHKYNFFVIAEGKVSVSLKKYTFENKNPLQQGHM